MWGENMVEFKQKTIDEIRKLPSLRERVNPKDEKSPVVGYLNSRQISSIKNIPIYVEDAVKAAMISRSNMLLLGRPGKGKTQLANSVACRYFNGEASTIRGSDWERDIKTLYTRINLEKYFKKEAKTSDELVELTDKVKRAFAVIDEINRCPEAMQGRFFQILEGKIELDDGRTVPLGDDGYLTFIATANKDPNRQSGIFKMDEALLGRCHVILNLDDFPILAEDSARIRIMGGLDPRVRSPNPLDNRERILSIYKDLKDIFNSTLSPELVIMSVYLSHGLNYCSKSPTRSKDTILEAIPGLCTAGQGCTRKAAGCGFILAPSDRTIDSIIRYTIALQAVAIAKDLKAAKVETDVSDVLEAFELISSYSVLLNEQWVVQNYMGNPYLALNTITDAIKKSAADRKNELAAAIEAYKSNKLTEKHLKSFDEEWEFMKTISKWGE